MKPELLDYELLVQTKRLIETPETWCQRFGHRISADGIDQYCAIGAFNKVLGTERIHSTKAYAEHRAWRLLNEAAKEVWNIPHRKENYPGSLPVAINDHTDHPTVMKMFDIAIAKAEALAR